MRALLQEGLDDTGRTRCDVCAHRCVLSPGQVGRCRVRQNVGGEIHYIAYDYESKQCPAESVCAAETACTGRGGCSWTCSFCASAATVHPEMASALRDVDRLGQEALRGDPPVTKDGFLDKRRIPGIRTILPMASGEAHPEGPDDVVRAWRESGKPGWAMRTSEPSIHLEWVLDVAKGVRAEGGFVLLGTNGYWTPETVDLLAPHVDLVEVGVKASLNPRFMRKVVGATKPEAVLETIRALVGCDVQVTVSDIPLFHDTWEQDFSALAEFVADVIPPRAHPRLILRSWAGSVASELFGDFRKGIPYEFDPYSPDSDVRRWGHAVGPREAPLHESVWVDRPALLVRATEIALTHLESVWLRPGAQPEELEALDHAFAERGFPAVAEGAIRVTRPGSEMSLPPLLVPRDDKDAISELIEDGRRSAALGEFLE